MRVGEECVEVISWGWWNCDSVSDVLVVLVALVVVEREESGRVPLTRSGESVCSGCESLFGGNLKTGGDSIAAMISFQLVLLHDFRYM